MRSTSLRSNSGLTIRSATFCDGLETLRQLGCCFWSGCVLYRHRRKRGEMPLPTAPVVSIAASRTATHCAAEHQGIAATFDKFLGGVFAALRHSAGDLQTFLAYLGQGFASS